MKCWSRIEGGLDFEKRILQIYDTCRQPEQIEKPPSMRASRAEEVIADRIKDTQSQLLENFDEDVHDRLKLRLDEGRRHSTSWDAGSGVSLAMRSMTVLASTSSPTRSH